MTIQTANLLLFVCKQDMQVHLKKQFWRKGHKTLLNNLRARLGNDLSVDEIISRIQNDAGPAFCISGEVSSAQ